MEFITGQNCHVTVIGSLLQSNFPTRNQDFVISYSFIFQERRSLSCFTPHQFDKLEEIHNIHGAGEGPYKVDCQTPQNIS